MKFPLSLLQRFLDTNASLDEIAAKLTAIGLEVENIEDHAKALAPFVVAEVLEAAKHPQADKLSVCKVKTQSGTLQIVCGAPNARAGIKVALANVGTVIPASNMEIKKATVRGVESQGMLCSARELGLGEDHAGIIELPADAKIGASIVEVLGLNDPVIDLNVTANRGDCLGVLGIARDLAAAGMGTLKPPCVPEMKAKGKCPVPITIEDTDGCYAFLGRAFKGVKNGPSPDWMQKILTAAGMRPISALVDITNYFTLAFGRPLHVYDISKLDGGIIVRKGKAGEKLAALNEKTYSVRTHDCVIADTKKVLGLGGIMGGTYSGVTENTKDVLLEMALFNPVRIARTGRELQIESDARQRFERGVDPGFLEIADARATEMILELCGGEASENIIAGKIPAAPAPVTFDAKAVNALGGANVPEAKQKEILAALGFTINGNKASVPPWRHDVSQPADLTEEVLRIVGYDSIPTMSLPKHSKVSHPALTDAQSRVVSIRRTLAGRGLYETYAWGFVSEKQALAFGGQSATLKLVNPISEELSVMRPNLLPHLIAALNHNTARGQDNLALFELGAVFESVTPTGQRTVAAGVRIGAQLHWKDKTAADVFAVKADVAAALAAAGTNIAKCQIERGAPGWYHPGKSGVVKLGPKVTLAQFGELHPGILKQLDCDVPVMAFELFIDAIPATKTGKRKALKLSDYQPVRRDFAFVVDAATPAAELVKAVNAAEKALTRNVTIFDVYEGKGVAPGKKSIALAVTLQADDRTLTDAEIEKACNAMIASARATGATLRFEETLVETVNVKDSLKVT